MRTFGAVLATGGWCLLVAVAALMVQVGLGAALLPVLGDPVVATVAGGVLVVLGGTVVRTQRPWWVVLPRTARGWEPRQVHRGDALRLLGLLLAAFLAGQAAAGWLQTLVDATGFEASQQSRQDAGLAWTLILTLLVAPVAEEVLFRGTMYPLLRRRVGVPVAVAVTTLTFGVLHANVIQFVVTVPLSVLLALVLERTGRLWPCILLHLGFNLAATLVPPSWVSPVADPLFALLALAGLVVGTLLWFRGGQRHDRVGDRVVEHE